MSSDTLRNIFRTKQVLKKYLLKIAVPVSTTNPSFNILKVFGHAEGKIENVRLLRGQRSQWLAITV